MTEERLEFPADYKTADSCLRFLLLLFDIHPGQDVAILRIHRRDLETLMKQFWSDEVINAYINDEHLHDFHEIINTFLDGGEL